MEVFGTIPQLYHVKCKAGSFVDLRNYRSAWWHHRYSDDVIMRSCDL